MARSSSTTGRTRSARGRAKSSVRVDMSNISKAFEPNQEYAIRCTEATLEEGQKAPYFNLKLQGIEDGDYENSIMYHRASTGEASLWRFRPLLEAFGIEITDGPMDIDASDFVGKEAMCSTYLDRYDGGSSVKPDEFWPLDGSSDDSDKKDEAPEFDLDELEDEQIEALAEALEVTGRNVAAKKKALAKMDQEEVAEAFAGLEDEGGDPEFDLAKLSDDDVMALAEHMELEASTARKAKAALKKEDDEEVAEAWAEVLAEREEASKKSSKGGKGKSKDEPKDSGKAGRNKKKEEVTEEQIQEMNEDELEEVVKNFELDLDLSEHKTLRKMKNAVIDAMEEGGHLDG